MSKYLKDPEGAAAFPVPEDFRDYGMSLRDWFAGQALAGLCAPSSFMRTDAGTEAQAVWAYELADAMLRARQRRQGVE